MRGLQLVAAFLLLASISAVAVQGSVKTYNWTVGYAYSSPDCVEKLGIAVNGQHPGPAIRAIEGDTIIVNVHNSLNTESVVIHWHGMIQRGTPWSDGAAFVSQCPISPGDSFQYQFVVENPGTYFYHGHHAMQRAAGFYGSLIVDPKPGAPVPFKYDGELSILLNDWWHKSIYEQELGLLSNPFVWVGEPQSLLIEGRGAYNCSLVPTGAVPNSGDCVTCNASHPECTPHIMPVEPGKTYRLRIASVASLSALNFVLEGHNLTVVEADGHYVEPVVVDNLDVYTGESYSVLFTANQDPSKNYWAGINVRARKPKTPTGLAVLNYIPNPSTLLPKSPAPVSPAWDDYNVSLAKARLYKAHGDFIVPLPQRPTNKRLILLNTQGKNNGVNKWAINNVTYKGVSFPILAAYTFNLTSQLTEAPPESYTHGYDIYNPPANPTTNEGNGAYEFQLGDLVEVVLQNTNALAANVSEIHPWHLHGHDFWVLGYGDGVFQDSDYVKLNTVNPPLRNTVPLFPYGWTVIRFVADNPGVWPFHCHIEPHVLMGMGVVFAEGIHQLPPMPRQALGCGITKNL